MTRKRFFIIDGFSHVFRAYYGIRNIDNNAAYGITTMLRKLLNDEQPEYIAVAFDTSEPTFRKELYQAYKANRQAMPEDLVPQIPIIKDIIRAMNIPIVEAPGFEADDIIGTLAVQAAEQGYQAVIVSGDKDMLQLVKGDDIVVYDAKKDVYFLDEGGLPDFFGVRADQIIDLLTIWGDSSDNVPGVKGVGEKGAKKLLQEYGSLDNIYQNLESIKRKSYREGFELAKEHIDLTRKLVTIHTSVKDVAFDEERFRMEGVDADELTRIFAQYGFKSLLDNMPVKMKTLATTYTLIDDEKGLTEWIAAIREQKFFVFDVETTSLDPISAELVGFAIALAPGKAAYVPLRHEGQDAAWVETAESALKAVMADAGITKCAHNAKYDLSVLMALGWALEGAFDDTMLMSYLIAPTDNRHGLDALAESRLNYRTIHFEDLCGEGEDQVTFEKVSPDKACDYASEDADICFQLFEMFNKELDQQELRNVYEKVERPLIPVLTRMELSGIRVDEAYLEAMSGNMAEQIAALEKEIYALAGEEFNIKSTKQLGEILFEKLELPVGRKTSKTKSYSTSQDVLEKLVDKHPLPGKLLEYRMLTKLKSTYVDALPTMIHAKTGRVHSSFNQFVTATGRLSSNNPNLQNIPIRTEAGREIRGAFLPESGWVLVAADYSQIELRLMAHFSEDKTLVDAFEKGEDIHARTAGEIMDVSPDLITPDMRSAAKSINFGLIYGMGDFRLAQELNIPRKKAREYMDTYFEKMPRVLEFRDEIIAKARQAGEIRTFSGRKRDLPEINSRNKNLQAQGERLAVNTLIQGSAAEIIKLAMIELDLRLRKEKSKARLLLQVHDELVLECPQEEVADVQGWLKETMEGVVSFKVPLTVDVHTGNNWKETK